jgi:hypothetical protein
MGIARAAWALRSRVLWLGPRIACPSENVLYIADENNWRVQKLLLHPERTRTTALNR